MSKKTTLSIIAVIIGLFYISIGFYQQWLILAKIQGTDLMYFLFWMSVPLAIVINLIAEAIKTLRDD